MTMTDNILDVTVLEPKEKHPTIFRRFDDLEAGEALTIHNDHDPKPLYYQMIGERGNIFDWEYLENGPEWWKVRITKRIPDQNGETVGELAAKDLRKVEVFRKYGIDFCCGGKRTVKEACESKGLDYDKIEKELHETEGVTKSRPLPYNEWKPDFLADYIVNTHHTYVQKTLPELRHYARKVAGVHGKNHPQLLEINQLVENMAVELESHMMKEERILFPYIRELVRSKEGESSFGDHLGTIRNPVNVMEMEHESAGEKLARIRELTKNFTLPEDACASYGVLYRMLQEFEEDLHLHIHLENNILFPKALELEESILN